MTRKQYAISGLLAPVIFWLTYFILSNQRPEYSFFTKAISELGSVDAPLKWIWNVFGYIIPGILISVFSIGLYKYTKNNDSGRIPLIGIMFSGLFMVVSGIFPGDFEDRDSVTMLLHTIGSLGSYIFFLIGAFTYPKLMKKTTYWSKTVKPSMAFALLTILFGSWVFIFPNIPAVGQRIVFVFYFLWIFYNSYKLYFYTPARNNSPEHCLYST